jgi:hypothetical protein
VEAELKVEERVARRRSMEIAVKSKQVKAGSTGEGGRGRERTVSGQGCRTLPSRDEEIMGKSLAGCWVKEAPNTAI